jgi:hypothetical protein
MVHVADTLREGEFLADYEINAVHRQNEYVKHVSSNVSFIRYYYRCIEVTNDKITLGNDVKLLTLHLYLRYNAVHYTKVLVVI